MARGLPWLQEEKGDWEWVVRCVLFDGHPGVCCWQSKELAVCASTVV